MPPALVRVKNLAYGEGQADRILKALKSGPTKANLSVHYLQTALNFVRKCTTQYEADQLARKRNAAGKPLCWSIFRRILTIDDKELRERLIQRWEDESLSVTKIQRAIEQETGVLRSRAGSAPKRPKNSTEALRQAHEMARRWSRWHDIVETVGPKGKASQMSKLPQKLRRLLKKIAPQIREIEVSALKSLKLKRVLPKSPAKKHAKAGARKRR